tara:strand:- start:6343 stop:8664 length:2322 start_codon:yes stop_codon:yes gene_type:complete
MILFTFDLETENHKLNKRLASPFDPRNYIVQAGWSVNGGEPQEKYYTDYHRTPVLPVDILKQMGKGDMFLGFNIKFDLLWVWDEPELQAALKRGATIYCGQYAEYLLGGQTQDVQMCAMNDIAEKYGGGCKIDAVKEMWTAGYLTSQIPRNLLTDYLVGNEEIVGDVHNTWKIYCGQVNRMKTEHPKEFRTMLKFRMDGLLATCEMEHNGVHCDATIGAGLRADLIVELEKATDALEGFIPALPPELVFNWASNTHKSCLIYGGTVKYSKWLPHTDDNGNVLYTKKTEQWPLFYGEQLPTGECIKAGALYVREVPEGEGFEHGGKYYQAQDTFKSGKRAGEGKFKNVQMDDTDKPKGAQQPHYFQFDGYIKPHHSWQSDSTDAYDQPLYKTGAKIIEKLKARGLPFTDALSLRTGLDKDLGTYYWKEDKKGAKKGMLTLVDFLSLIHHKLNHTSTVTSRLSSSDPNLQNVPKADTSNVKKMFTSRFGADGKMCEIDYSQLEVVIQGVLSRDQQLMADLNNRIDFHCKRLAKKLGEDYQHVWDMCHVHKNEDYKVGRTNAKVFSFQRAYGAGAATISDDTGIPKSEVEALIIAEEQLYPAVVQFDKMLEASINESRIATSAKLFINGVAFTQGESHWDSPTGTRYIWREGITPEFMHKHGKYTGFSPTERKNYPVQGFGGEVVQTMLGIVFRYMLANDRYNNEVLLVNTVHDCLWLDGKTDKINEVALEVQAILESVPEVFNKAYPELNIEVPFPCETEIGDDMFTMTTLHKPT